MTSFDFLLTSILFASLSALIASYALIQRHRADKFARLVAENQAIFKKSSIEISPYSFTESQSEFYILAAPLHEKEVFEFPFEVGIHNIGAMTA
jgi:hypothetical protein